MSNSPLGVWQQQTMLTYQQSWNAISDVAGVILDVEPDFVPEDPICESQTINRSHARSTSHFFPTQ
jgi:hypothetical protein